MNKIVALIFAGSGFLVSGQQIAINKDQCQHCAMAIRDARFAALVSDSEGNTQKFDAIECLINFLKEKDEQSFEKILVADYSKSASWVDARIATYMKSSEIPSPMGAYLSAYADREMAEKVLKGKGGELFDWTEIKARFKDSRFGVLDHVDHHHNPDAYAPIGIMGDHMHHRGSWMISLRYMYMGMNGMLKGSAPANHMDIHINYMVAPEKMEMHMYMLGAMYAPTDKLTVMVMQNILQKEMKAMTMMGMQSTSKMEAAGLGDTRITVLYSLLRKEKASFHLNSGLNVPFGRITKTDDMPMMGEMKMPYPMQLGSGTIDAIVGGTFQQACNKMSWGAQQLSTLRTGKNSEGYHQGNEYILNAWGGFNVTSWMSVSARMEGLVVSGIAGEDQELDPMMSPAADAGNSGFTRARSYLGSNFSFGKDSTLKNLKVGVECGFPVYQNVKGIQMDESNMFNAGIQYKL